MMARGAREREMGSGRREISLWSSACITCNSITAAVWPRPLAKVIVDLKACVEGERGCCCTFRFSCYS